MRTYWLLILATVVSATAQTPRIVNFDAAGRLDFRETTNAAYYRIEHTDALSPTGGLQGAWTMIDEAFPATGPISSRVVPTDPATAMFFRVVAVVAEPDPARTTVRPDEVTTGENQPRVIDVIANDTPPEGQSLSVIGVTPANIRGQVLILGDGLVLYEPDPAFDALPAEQEVEELFVYTVRDTVGREASSLVLVTVQGTNDSPRVVADLYVVQRGQVLAPNDPYGLLTPELDDDDGVLANDHDVDAGDMLTASLASGPLHATHFELFADGTFVYQHDPADPASEDTFSYEGVDLSGAGVPADVHIAIQAPIWPWQNPSNRFDVTADGLVTPLDALRLIDEINLNGPGSLPVPPPAGQPPPFLDVTGDGALSPQDVLILIDYINKKK